MIVDKKLTIASHRIEFLDDSMSDSSDVPDTNIQVLSVLCLLLSSLFFCDYYRHFPVVIQTAIPMTRVQLLTDRNEVMASASDSDSTTTSETPSKRGRGRPPKRQSHLVVDKQEEANDGDTENKVGAILLEVILRK